MPYKFDKEGRYVKTDPLENILKPATPTPTPFPMSTIETPTPSALPPSPTNIPGVTPQEAAAKPLATPAPKIASAAVPTGKATIWNPNTGEKKVVNIGESVPQGWNLWTGGTATGAEAQEAIIAGQPPAEEPMKPEDMAAAPLEEPEIIEEPTVEEDPWEIPNITEILEGFGIEKITPTDFTQDYTDLENWQTNQLEAINTKYEEKFAEQNKADENSLGALQAKLLKAGVSLDGTSFQSATAGEIARAEERIRKIERDKAMEEANVRNSFIKGKMDLGKQEREEVWNAQVTNINNIFKGYDLATNIWDSFNKRAEFDRSQEQSAQEHLEKMTLEYHKLDEKAKSTQLGMLENFIKDGLFDVYNEDVANMLYKMEELNGLETGSLVNSATGGYWDRMSEYALKGAQTAKTEAETEKTLAEIEKMKAKTLAAGLEAEEGGYPKGFWSAIKTATDSLRKGEKWGTVFDRMKLQFSSVDNDIIDKVLGGSWNAAKETGEGWAEEGAFEEWKSKQYKVEAPTQASLKSDVWKQIAANPNVPDDVIKEWIMGEGFNPEDFGYY